MNWYKISQSAPEPNPEQIYIDAINGVNISPLVDFELDKIASITGHWRHVSFINSFSKLPNEVKKEARRAFRKMIHDPSIVKLTQLVVNRSGKYKVFSARIGMNYRALALRVGSIFIWYWIGTHESYNRKKDTPPPILPPELEALTQKPGETS